MKKRKEELERVGLVFIRPRPERRQDFSYFTDEDNRKVVMEVGGRRVEVVVVMA